MKWARAVPSARDVTIATIVYIPELSGFWAQSFDVLKLCLQSIIDNTRVPFDLLLLDNGSCEEVRDYLLELSRQDGIQLLVLSSENLGKLGAWNVLFPAARGKVIAYTDSDVVFYPGWLEQSLEIFRAFPDVGMVTARPFRTAPEVRKEILTATDKYAETADDVLVERGNLIDPQVLETWIRSTGSQPHAQALTQPPHEDIRLTRNGVRAYVYAAHFQFLVAKETAMKIVPFESLRPLGDAREWDRKLNALGKLRLSTTTALVHHVGNTIDAAELAGLGASIGSRPARGPSRDSGGLRPFDRGLRTLARSNRMRWAMNKAYLSLFRALHSP